MLLEVRHVTQYQYEAPIRESVFEVWMQPQKSASQRLVSFELELDPSAHVFSYADYFGNAVYHFDIPQSHDQLTIIARSAVETSSNPELPTHLDRGEWTRLTSDFVRGECFDFLQPHGYVQATPALAEFVAKHGLESLRQNDPLSALIGLNKAIHNGLGYDAGVTEADSPIDEALQAGRGVCQDFAHIMIAICRSWGIPARYVSGYLFNDRVHGDRSDPDATHAWVEVFLPTVRWVGFDPTNNVLTGERHITVAVGRDYADVPPSRGIFKGETASQLSVGVSVRRARATAAEPEYIRNARPAPPGARRRNSELHDQSMQQQQQ